MTAEKYDYSLSNLDRLDGQPHDSSYYFAPRSPRIAAPVTESMTRAPEPRMTGREILVLVAAVAFYFTAAAIVLVVVL